MLGLARTLWLQGHPAQAVERVHRAIRDTERMDHPASLALVLAGAASILLWTGDLQSAEDHTDASIYYAEANSLRPLVAIGRCRKAEIAIRRGDAKDGVESLQAALQKVRAARHDMITTEFNMTLVQGLAALGQHAEGVTLIDKAIRRVEANGDVSYMPELLRLKGSLVLSNPQPSVDDAEMCFMQSLELSRRQGARAWELRTATDLATLFARQGRSGRGRPVLEPVFEQFTEGFATADLRAAKQVLASLG